MMKKIIIPLILTLIFSLGCSFTQKRFAIKQCPIKFSGVKFNKVTRSGIDTTLKLKVDNQHDFDVIIEEMELELFVNDIKAGNIKIPRTVIEPKEKKKIEINIVMEYKQLKDVAKIILKEKRNAIYNLKGTAYIDFGAGSVLPIPINIKKQFKKKEDGEKN